MSYEQFQEKLLEVLRDQNQNLTFQTEKRVKNNGQLRIGFSISDTHEKKAARPVIYLEPFFKQYQAGESLESIADTIIQIYHTRPDLQYEKERITDFDKAKEWVVMRLINTKDNLAFLEHVPHMPFHDLSIIFCLLVNSSKEYFTIISNELLKARKTDQATLYHHAYINTRNLFPAEFADVYRFIPAANAAQLDQSRGTADGHSSESSQKNMHVLTNKTHQWGAIFMIYDDILEKIADYFQEDFYIFPSSTHEVMIAPKSLVPVEEQQLHEMICQINQAIVDRTEWLSDHAYYYEKGCRKIRSCA